MMSNVFGGIKLGMKEKILQQKRWLTKRYKHILGLVATMLVLGQGVLAFLSWVITSVFADTSIHSLLSSDGIRWLFGHFISNLTSPVIVWILLLAMAFGAVYKSKLHLFLLKKHKLQYRQVFGLKVVIIEVLIYCAVISWLALGPQAMLLGVTGHLYPGIFSRSIVAQISFLLILVSVTYGAITATIKGMDDIYDMLTIGLSYSAPILLMYILSKQLYSSLLFVFT